MRADDIRDRYPLIEPIDPRNARPEVAAPPPTYLILAATVGGAALVAFTLLCGTGGLPGERLNRGLLRRHQHVPFAHEAVLLRVRERGWMHLRALD